MNEQAILAEAKELIIRKQYQAARQLLQPIAHNPTAQKWLVKLDEIAPPPPVDLFVLDDDPFADPFANPANYGGFSSPRTNEYAGLTDEEKFARVKELLQAKQYEQARAILLTVPHDPSAQKLLAKLDQISKPPTVKSKPPVTADAAAPVQFNLVANDNPFAVKPPTITYEGVPPYAHPWNPRNFVVVIVMFGAGALVILSLNWRRFGRPKWALPSFLIGLATLAVPIGGVLLVGAMGGTIRADVASIPIIGGFLAFYGFLLGNYAMQEREYQRYQTYGNIGGNKYAKDTYWLVGASVVLVVGLLIAVMLTASLVGKPKKITTNYLTLEKPQFWDTEPSNTVEYCGYYSQGCFLFMHYTGTDPKVMAFVRYPSDGTSNETQVAALWQEYQNWYAGLTFGPRTELTVDGISVTFQEFTTPPFYPDAGGPPLIYYASRGYVPVADGLIEITFWAGSESEMRQYYGDFTDILDSIRLTHKLAATTS